MPFRTCSKKSTIVSPANRTSESRIYLEPFRCVGPPSLVQPHSRAAKFQNRASPRLAQFGTLTRSKAYCAQYFRNCRRWVLAQ